MSIEPAGVVEAGEDWVVTLDGTEYRYTAQAGDDLADVADQLAVLLGAAPGFAAGRDAGAVWVTRLAGGASVGGGTRLMGIQGISHLMSGSKERER